MKTSNAHLELHYHLVIVTKYRRKLFTTQQHLDFISEAIGFIAQSHNVKLTEINGEEDHVHILFEAHVITNLAQFINSTKSYTSRKLKIQFPEMGLIQGDALWSPSYYIATVGQSTIDTVQAYIQNQNSPQ